MVVLGDLMMRSAHRGRWVEVLAAAQGALAPTSA
jgi:hypothetical protein